jgi:hypothetical protein
MHMHPWCARGTAAQKVARTKHVIAISWCRSLQIDAATAASVFKASVQVFSSLLEAQGEYSTDVRECGYKRRSYNFIRKPKANEIFRTIS